MTTDRLAAVSYRLLAPRAHAEGTGDHDSLENVITDALPNGALCWVNSTEGLYRLDKFDNSTAALAGIVIIPLSGPGRWILLVSGSPAAQFSAEVFLKATDLLSPDLPVLVPVPGQWEPGPSVPPGPGTLYNGFISPVFTLDPFAGTLTYLGPTRRYLLETYASMRVDTSSDFILGLTANVFDGVSNDRITTTTNDGTEGLIESVIGVFWPLSAARSVELSAGDVIRPAITDIIGESSFDLIVRRLHLVATPFA